MQKIPSEIKCLQKIFINLFQNGLAINDSGKREININLEK